MKLCTTEEREDILEIKDMTKQQRNTEKEIIREELVELKLHYEIDDEKLKEKFKMGKRGFLFKNSPFFKASESVCRMDGTAPTPHRVAR